MAPVCVAQTTPPLTVRGDVRSTDGRPLSAVNVFVLETLEGALSDSAGRFLFATTARPPFTVVAKRLGYRPREIRVSSPDSTAISFVLSSTGAELIPIQVQAGRYTAGAEQVATLTPLQVVTTPGTAADINRAVQTLPGVQQVDDGNGLFVRGGDYTETKIFLNDAVLLNPQQLSTPNGTFLGTVDPFQLDEIVFASGGFGARYGNAMSGVVGLRTAGLAKQSSVDASIGLAALSASAAFTVSPQWSVRLAGNRQDLAPFLRLNGSPRDYSPAPRGHDLSVSVAYAYRPSAEIKLFSIQQTSVVGIASFDRNVAQQLSSDDRTALHVLTWRDRFGRVAPTFSLSHTGNGNNFAFGSLASSGTLDQSMIFGALEIDAHPRTVVRVGGEAERLASRLDGSVPASATSRVTFAYRQDAVRIGPFLEMDQRVASTVRIVAGIRTDHSTLSARQTVDPRLSVAWKPVTGVTLTAAWGVYHQIASPLQYDSTIGVPDAPSMRSVQQVIGAQFGSGDLQARVELYAKQYTDLLQRRRDYSTVAGGSGHARGVDLFVRGPLFAGITGRVTLSALTARRTDPESGALVRAPFDIPASMTTVLERRFGGVSLGVAYRSSTGRPFSPVIGATFVDGEDRYEPTFGAAYSERLPDIHRVDLSTSWFRPLSARWQLVTFASLSNAMNRLNTQSYQYNRDYTRRSPVRSLFARGVYMGASLTHR